MSKYMYILLQFKVLNGICTVHVHCRQFTPVYKFIKYYYIHHIIKK